MVKYFKNVIPSYRKSLIFTRLGHQKTKTDLSGEYEHQLNREIAKAESFCRLTVGYRIIDIANLSSPTIQLSNNITWSSMNLSKFLEDSSQVLLMFSTTGQTIMDQIHRLINDGDMSKAVIYDAVASVVVDAGLDWLMEYLERNMVREGKTLTRTRFSAGYGDFDLKYQKDMYELLELEDKGVKIKESFLLIPEKTVTAVAGILGG